MSRSSGCHGANEGEMAARLVSMWVARAVNVLLEDHVPVV